MANGTGPTPPARPSGRAVVRYGLLRFVAGCLAVTLVVCVIRAADDDVATISPAHSAELDAAAHKARCELRAHRGGRPLDLPIDGEAASPARPGVYDRPQDTAALVRAIRRGYVVIHYRPGVAKSRIDELRDAQRAVPTATIVAPNLRMRYQLAVTAWHRFVGCTTFNDDAMAAVRLFRAGYLGSGSDAPRGRGW